MPGQTEWATVAQSDSDLVFRYLVRPPLSHLISRVSLQPTGPRTVLWITCNAYANACLVAARLDRGALEHVELVEC